MGTTLPCGVQASLGDGVSCRRAGALGCGASVTAVHRLSCLTARGIFLDWRLNPWPSSGKVPDHWTPGNSLFLDRILMALHPRHTSLLSMSNIPGGEEGNFSRSLPDFSPAFTVNPNPLADWDFPSLPPYG